MTPAASGIPSATTRFNGAGELLTEGLDGFVLDDPADDRQLAERLRLLYVGITRARRNLFVSRSRAVTVYQREQETGPASALGALYHHLQETES